MTKMHKRILLGSIVAFSIFCTFYVGAAFIFWDANWMQNMGDWKPVDRFGWLWTMILAPIYFGSAVGTFSYR